MKSRNTRIATTITKEPITLHKNDIKAPSIILYILPRSFPISLEFKRQVHRFSLSTQGNVQLIIFFITTYRMSTNSDYFSITFLSTLPQRKRDVQMTEGTYKTIRRYALLHNWLHFAHLHTYCKVIFTFFFLWQSWMAILYYLKTLQTTEELHQV